MMWLCPPVLPLLPASRLQNNHILFVGMFAKVLFCFPAELGQYFALLFALDAKLMIVEFRGYAAAPSLTVLASHGKGDN